MIQIIFINIVMAQLPEPNCPFGSHLVGNECQQDACQTTAVSLSFDGKFQKGPPNGKYYKQLNGYDFYIKKGTKPILVATCDSNLYQVNYKGFCCIRGGKNQLRKCGAKGACCSKCKLLNDFVDKLD